MSRNYQSFLYDPMDVKSWNPTEGNAGGEPKQRLLLVTAAALKDMPDHRKCMQWQNPQHTIQ